MFNRLGKPLAKVFVLALLCILIASFAIWGIGDIFSGRQNRQVVAKIGKDAVDLGQFQRAFNRSQRFYESQGGDPRLLAQPAVRGQIAQMAIHSSVRTVLLAQLRARHNLALAPQDLQKRLASFSALHNQDGVFDPQLYQNFLNRQGLSAVSFEQELAQETIDARILAAISRPASVDRHLLAALDQALYHQRRPVLLFVPRARPSSLQEPAQSVLEEYFATHSQDFFIPEKRSGAFLLLAGENFIGKRQASDAELAALYEERKSEFFEPESRSFRQFVVATREDAQRAAAELRAGSGDWDAQARKETQASTIFFEKTTKRGLEAQIPELARAVFATNLGEISEPLSSPFGWHLFIVDEILPSHQPSFSEVAPRLRKERETSWAQDILFETSEQLDELLTLDAPLSEAAAELSLPLFPFTSLSRRAQSPSKAAASRDPERLRERLITSEVFRETLFSLASGETSLVKRSQDGDYFAVTTMEVSPGKIPEFADVSREVLAHWQETQATEQARTQGQDLIAELKTTTPPASTPPAEKRRRVAQSLKEFAAAKNLKVEELDPLDRLVQPPTALAAAMIPTIFRLEPGQVVMLPTPPDLADVPAGFVLLTVAEVIAPRTDEERQNLLAQRLLDEARQGLENQFVQALQSKETIEFYPEVVRRALGDDPS